jgi:AP-3 complex subunit beta
VYPQRAIQNIAVPSRVTTPVVLTPGGAPSPVGSFTQRAKWIDLDLDKFYDDDDDDSDDSEENNEEEESSEEIQDAPSQEVTTPQSEDEEESEEEDSEVATEDSQRENVLPASR